MDMYITLMYNNAATSIFGSTVLLFLRWILREHLPEPSTQPPPVKQIHEMVGHHRFSEKKSALLQLDSVRIIFRFQVLVRLAVAGT